MNPEEKNLEFPQQQRNGNEDGKRDFPQGVLDHLELLEFQSHQEALEQEKKEKWEEKSIFLKNKIQELRLQRDELREKVEKAQKRGKVGIPSDSGILNPREVLEWKIRNLQELLQLFQLTGLSGKLSKHGVSFSIPTSFENSFLDSFHLELRAAPAWRILRHSVPPFIPLESISREFLPAGDLRGFLDCLSRRLNAFVGRREQLDRVLEFLPAGYLRGFLDCLSRQLNAFVGRREQLDRVLEFFPDCIQGIPQRNSLCNLLSFRYRIPGKSGNFQARLVYRDCRRILPTDVDVSCSPESPELSSAHAELFRRLALPRAFQTLKSTDFTP